MINLDVQQHLKKFENDFSYFQNQAIVNELGEGGPISLDLNKVMPRRTSETDHDNHTVDMQQNEQKRAMVNAEIIR